MEAKVKHSLDHSWHGLLPVMEVFVGRRISTRIGNQAATSQNIRRHGGQEHWPRDTEEGRESSGTTLSGCLS